MLFNDLMPASGSRRLSHGSWLKVLLPRRRAIGSRWIFKIKRLPDGSIDKYKGRIVAQGYLQIQGVHYNEVFASTACMAAMHTVIAIKLRRLKIWSWSPSISLQRSSMEK
jgi:Reverse transcriptase (RNA-dependent DNA polymerase)